MGGSSMYSLGSSLLLPTKGWEFEPNKEETSISWLNPYSRAYFCIDCAAISVVNVAGAIPDVSCDETTLAGGKDGDAISLEPLEPITPIISMGYNELGISGAWP